MLTVTLSRKLKSVTRPGGMRGALESAAPGRGAGRVEAVLILSKIPFLDRVRALRRTPPFGLILGDFFDVIFS